MHLCRKHGSQVTSAFTSSFDLSTISSPTLTLTLFFPCNTSCLLLMVRMGLWVDVTSVFSPTAIQEEGGGFSHLRERKTGQEKEEENDVLIETQMCAAAGRISDLRSLGNSFFHSSRLIMNVFHLNFFLCSCVCIFVVPIRMW